MAPNIITVPQRQPLVPYDPQIVGAEIFRTRHQIQETPVVRHDLAEIPAGWTIIGSPQFGDAKPHWRYVNRFFIGTTAVTEQQAHAVLGVRKGYDGSDHIVTDNRWNHPAVYMSWNDAILYVKKLNEMMVQREERWRFGLPTEAGWEKAARDLPINVLEQMEIQGITMNDFWDWAKNRIENLYLEIGPDKPIFQLDQREEVGRMLRENQKLSAYWVFGNPEGLKKEKIWYDRYQEAREEEIKTAPVTWGTANILGAFQLIGNTWEWCIDTYDEAAYQLIRIPDQREIQEIEKRKVVRGGCWNGDLPDIFFAAFRSDCLYPVDRIRSLGVRVAAFPQDSN